MPTRIADYDPSITEPSKLELISMAKWLQENKFKACLVGGWAVYYWTKAGTRPPAKYGEAVYDRSRYDDPHGFRPLGSKDIDLVFGSKAQREEFERGVLQEKRLH